MDSTANAVHTRTGGPMVTLTPVDHFSNEQIFHTPYMSISYDALIAVLVVTVNNYPVEGLYINNQSLDVSMTTGFNLFTNHCTYIDIYSYPHNLIGVAHLEHKYSVKLLLITMYY